MPAQQERALATRERILEATMEAIRERGIPGTTTVEVCERAGLARGTLLHHFPTRETLVAAALERGADQALAFLRETHAQDAAGADAFESGVRALWAMVDEPKFAIWLELVVAARADPRLREVVQDLSDRFLAIGEDVLGFDPVVTQLAYAAINGFMLDRVLDLNGDRIEQALARLPAALRAAA
jgi:AcrR family transcriptional regulator